MSEAVVYLNRTPHDPAKAVQILEDNLPIINGHRKYLILLRDAYRAYIMDLKLTNQATLAKKYLSRLEIIDSSAAKDPALRLPVVTEPVKQPPTTAALAVATPPAAPRVSDNGKNLPVPPTPFIARGKLFDADPFRGPTKCRRSDRR